MELTVAVFHKVIRTAAALGSAMFVIACDRHNASAAPGAKAAGVSASLEAAVPTGSTPVNIEMPAGSDSWVFSAPYTLEENWSKLNINARAEDRKRLIDLNNSQENVLLVRINGDRLVESTYLGGTFCVSPSTFVVQAGHRLRLTRREGTRPILIERAIQAGGD